MDAARFAADATAAIANCRPARVQLDVALNEIPTGQCLLAGAVSPGSDAYNHFLAAANGVLAEAFEELREEHGYTELCVATPFDNEATDGPDITAELVSVIQRITNPLETLRKAG